MSYVISGLPAYVEQQNFPLVRAAVLGAKTAQVVRIQAGVKGSSTINIENQDSIFQAGNCGFSPSGSTTYSQRTINTGFISVQKKWCPSDLDATYLQYQTKPGSYQTEIPFEQEFTDYQNKLIQAEIEKALWQGDKSSATNNLSYFDGFIKNISGSGAFVTGSYHVSSSSDTTVFSGSNIANVLAGVYQAVPTAIKDADDLVIFVGRDVMTAYQSYLFNANLYHYAADSANGEMKLFPFGTRIIAVNGLNSVAKVPIFAGRLSNFVIGVDLEKDSSDYWLKYVEADDEVRFKAKFRIGTQVAFPNEIVYFYNGQ